MLEINKYSWMSMSAHAVP